MLAFKIISLKKTIFYSVKEGQTDKLSCNVNTYWFKESSQKKVWTDYVTLFLDKSHSNHWLVTKIWRQKSLFYSSLSNQQWRWHPIVKQLLEFKSLTLGETLRDIGREIMMRKKEMIYIYRILWCNGHIITFKNHTKNHIITFTEW